MRDQIEEALERVQVDFGGPTGSDEGGLPLHGLHDRRSRLAAFHSARFGRRLASGSVNFLPCVTETLRLRYLINIHHPSRSHAFEKHGLR